VEASFPDELEEFMSIANATTDAEILAAIIAPDRDDLPPEVARFVLRFAFSEAQKEKMRELADKNNRGELTDADRAVMESYLRVGDFMSLVQAKARISLKRSGQEHF
jgi:hypothetical protein